MIQALCVNSRIGYCRFQATYEHHQSSARGNCLAPGALSPRLLHMFRPGSQFSRKLIQERLRLDQVHCVEPLREPTVDIT